MTSSWGVQSQEGKSEGKGRSEAKKKDVCEAKEEGKQAQDGAVSELAIAPQENTARWELKLKAVPCPPWSG